MKVIPYSKKKGGSNHYRGILALGGGYRVNPSFEDISSSRTALIRHFGDPCPFLYCSYSTGKGGNWYAIDTVFSEIEN